MSWITTPLTTKWPSVTPSGVAVGEAHRVTNETRTGCGHPWTPEDRAALLALPGATESPSDFAACRSPRERHAHHARTPGVALRAALSLEEADAALHRK